MNNISLALLIGGFAFFFLGLKSSRKGLELVAGDRLRAAMGRVTSNRFLAFGFGVLVTLILQSSGATSAMLVNFAEIGLLNLFQATAVMLGADVGTTFVVILLSVKRIAEFSLVIFAIGAFMEIVAKRSKTRHIGNIILGFGLIFYGMHLMTVAADPLKNSEFAVNAFEFLAGHPFATMMLAVILSSAIHSAGTIGIAIALAFSGVLSIEAAVPIVLGANIGTCVTALVAGAASGPMGRRVALTHTFSKIIGVAIIFPFMDKFIGVMNRIDDAFVQVFLPGYQVSVAAKIAIVHILFNLFIAVLFLPLLKVICKAVLIIWPAPPPKKKAFGPKYLDKTALNTPTLAFAQAKREILRIGATAQWLFSDCLKMFSKGEECKDEIERIKNEDDRIDILEKAIRFYLADIATERLSTGQSRTQMALLGIAADLEEIGDTMSHELVHLADKKGRWFRMFSDEGWQDLRNFQSIVLENFNLMMSMLAAPSEEIGQKISRNKEHINEVEQQLRQAHINRLHQGLKESFETSSIHLDILANLRHINSKISHIAKLAMDT